MSRPTLEGREVGYAPALDLRQEPMLMQERLAEAGQEQNESRLQTVRLGHCKEVDHTLEVKTTEEVVT